MIKSNFNGKVESKRPFIFVLPTYAWRIPRLVEDFIRRIEFKGNKDVYFILTCGGDAFSADRYVKKLCEYKGFNLLGYRQIVMPDNYTILYNTPPYEEAGKIIKTSLREIEFIVDKVKKRDKLPEYRGLGWFFSGPINTLLNLFYVRDDKFHVNESCIKCGECVDNCPLNNISMEDIPRWQGNCCHCMACINLCPLESIEYGKKTSNRNRYYFKRKFIEENKSNI